MSDILEVKNLSVSFFTPEGEVEAVRDVSFTLEQGEVLAIVGESGCGKSMLCKSIMKLLPKNAKIKAGSIAAEGVEITGFSQKEMSRLRGRLFSMIFQNPMTALDPTYPVGWQIGEAVRIHNRNLKKEDVYHRVIELMELVGIDRPKERYKLYPYQFSGGMCQRSVLAMALANNPKILLADEPTTALDVTIQAQIIDLLRRIQVKLNTATILVSHDLGVVARAADRVAIMYAGKIVEIGKAKEIYKNPCHPYTWGLLQCLPSLAKDKESLYTIPGMPPSLIHPPKGDAFACRNEYALEIDYQEQPPMFQVSKTHYAATWLLDKRAPDVKFRKIDRIKASQKELSGKDILVRVEHLTHHFKINKNLTIPAVTDVSFDIRRGEIFGLVGESGSGKSTVARCMMNIYKPVAGRIFYEDINTCDKAAYKSNKSRLQSERQLIFQDCASALNMRMKVSDIIAEPMAIHKKKPPRGSFLAEAAFQLHYVGMEESYLDKYPFQLSGGQRQRVAIARTLSMEPKLLVADEPVASLDVSIQAQIINLFSHLRKEHGFSILFIAHDLALVEYLCDRVGVMYHGKLVEMGRTRELFRHPMHPYTRLLLSSIPVPDPILEQKRNPINFENVDFNLAGTMMEAEEGHFVLSE